jgi:peptidoglycan hydrolase CwlO-like protein
MSQQSKWNVIFALMLVVSLLSLSLAGQTPAQDQAAKLRQQLTDVQNKEAEQQTRLQQLEEDLKPENIEHSLAGVGSTHPEELREQRRRQLEKERDGVRTQLDQLATSRTRLEAAVAAADARAYQDSARGPQAATGGPHAPVEPATVTTPPKLRKPIKRQRRHARRTTQRPATAGAANQ